MMVRGRLDLWTVLAGVATVIVVPLALINPMLSLGALGALALLALAALAPEVAISVWLVWTLFVPSWSSLVVGGIYVSPSYLAIPVAFGLLVRRIRHSGPRFSMIDAGMLAAVALVVVYQAEFSQQSFLLTNVAITLFGGYVIGRFAEVSAGRVFAVAAVVLSCWGIAEWAFSWHAFTTWQAEMGGIGPAIQERGGLSRSEATLGHAIAYGAVLVAALPFTKAFKHPILMQLVLIAGVLVSLSRGPIIAAAFTLAIMFYVDRESKHRVLSGVLLVVGLAATYVLFTFLYSGSAVGELESSSTARDTQLGSAIASTNLIGPASGTQWDSIEGRYVTNGVEIVDSVFLRLALDFGWLVTALLLLPIVITIMAVFIRKGGPATIALAGQVPVLIVTSLITQWQVVIFFLAGIAVTELARKKSVTAKPAADVRGSRSRRYAPPVPERL